MWLIVVFAVIYFIFGDFFTDNFAQTPFEEKTDKTSMWDIFYYILSVLENIILLKIVS